MKPCSPEILKHRLYNRADAMSRLKIDMNIEWCINFIEEWEHVTNILKRRIT